MERNSYPDIDMKKTGLLLKNRIFSAGYSVKDIMPYLDVILTVRENETKR